VIRPYSFVVCRTGACFESKNIIVLLKYLIYVTGSLSVQNLWAKDIVDSILAVLCSFLHNDLICYFCKNSSMFTRYENAKSFKSLGVMSIPATDFENCLQL
jgi:uncharacterized membrane protein